MARFSIQKFLFIGLLAAVLGGTGVQANELGQTLQQTNASLEQRIANLQQQAADLNRQIASVDGEIAGLETERAALQVKLEAAKQAYNDALRDDYIAGPSDSVTVLATSQTFSEVVGQHEYRTTVSDKSQTAAEQLEALKAQINQKIASAEQRRSRLAALRGDQQKSLADAQAQVEAREALNELTLGDEQNFQRVAFDQRTQPLAQAVSSGVDGLIGSIGYARPGGNCVNEPGVNNPRTGNPINWPVTSYSPSIGATALWTYNHVGVVTGIWSNGDIEVRHQNYWGGQHRFPRSAFRGFR